MESPRIQLRPGSIWIDGQPVMVFSSSLFYFRIAAEEWRSRMKTLARLGYNAIDVYFPWNYHELEPGTWDFQGQRDAAAFLRMAREEGLWVVARPGPYICSEWDGGALPAYLSADPDIRLRDANPAYLQAVRRWFAKILPIVAGFQIDRGGTVIMLQIENELDFYDCQDRPGMMSALRDMAIAEGITVPIIACSGQGDIPGATGSVEGVVPTCNIYFDDRDPQIEERVRYYARVLEEMGYPLCIVETNRAHADLRRLIISGAKMVGPYLQAGGTDFGFTTGVTNWGDPLAFMTSHYDFHGMISPGGIVRPEGLEARLLTRMLETLSPAAALAKPVDKAPVRVTGEVVASALALDGGGWLVGLANPGEEPRRVTMGEGLEVIVAPKRCPFFLFELPLSTWGVEGHIACSTAEIVGRESIPDGLELSFVCEGPGEMVLRIPGAVPEEQQGWNIEQGKDTWRLWQEGAQAAGLAVFRLPENRRLLIRAVDRETAAGFSLAAINPAQPGEALPAPLDWQFESLHPCGDEWLSGARTCPPGHLHLEQNGIYRGYGWYRSAGLEREPKGLLVRDGADVLSIYAGSRYLGTLVPGGNDTYLPWQPGLPLGPEHPITVRAEIWGHANFDDARLPALRLKSLRGMSGMVAVEDVRNLTPTWFYQDGVKSPASSINPSWPYLYFGGWSTTREPAPGVYYQAVTFGSQADARILHFPELQVDIKVYSNGEPVGEATPFNPWVDLSSFTRPGATAELALAVDRRLRKTIGQVILYQGQSMKDWMYAGWGEKDFARLVNKIPVETISARLPYRLDPGKMGWLHTRIPEGIASTSGMDLIFEGKGLKVSAWVGNRLVGRVWLPGPQRPRMAGGLDNRVYLPQEWIHTAGGELHLLLESTGDDNVLSQVDFVVEN